MGRIWQNKCQSLIKLPESESRRRLYLNGDAFIQSIQVVVSDGTVLEFTPQKTVGGFLLNNLRDQRILVTFEEDFDGYDQPDD